MSHEPARITRPGRNCWCAPPARRAAVLVDAAAYFESLERSLTQATRSIFILGWDFDAAVRLCPASAPLGILLRSLVEDRPALEVRILVWDLSTVHGPGEALPLLVKTAWQEHPRIVLRLDGKHPLLAAHHQKLVCVDDAVAFAGGIDLTVARWDTREHAVEAQARRRPDGTAYGPVHDLQMAVDGEAARALASLARQRWEQATGEKLPREEAGGDRWPTALQPDFRDAPILIARTFPAYRRAHAIRESARLTLDALAAARRSIYIETQYLTSVAVRDLLSRILADPGGPDVVIVASSSSEGPLERLFMGGNRDRFIRRLRRCDPFNRLRVYYPVVASAEGERTILIHSKLIIVDDRFVRVGSSNLNNRSIGLDTECDLAVEAAGDADAAAIARLREGLLAEHLGVPREEVTAAVAAAGSLIGGIERLNHPPRGLRPFPAMSGTGPESPIPGTGIFDPQKPFAPLAWLHGRPLKWRF